eukprot:GHVU01229544.1.p1 GENE.GHVU01229544.1~~GHVU01229544.1.p1  ORF type:complete len:786 (+),score=46.53 GHVU01229544.1:173-2530(+)
MDTGGDQTLDSHGEVIGRRNVFHQSGNEGVRDEEWSCKANIPDCCNESPPYGGDKIQNKRSDLSGTGWCGCGKNSGRFGGAILEMCHTLWILLFGICLFTGTQFFQGKLHRLKRHHMKGYIDRMEWGMALLNNNASQCAANVGTAPFSDAGAAIASIGVTNSTDVAASASGLECTDISMLKGSVIDAPFFRDSDTANGDASPRDASLDQGRKSKLVFFYVGEDGPPCSLRDRSVLACSSLSTKSLARAVGKSSVAWLKRLSSGPSKQDVETYAYHPNETLVDAEDPSFLFFRPLRWQRLFSRASTAGPSRAVVNSLLRLNRGFVSRTLDSLMATPSFEGEIAVADASALPAAFPGNSADDVSAIAMEGGVMVNSSSSSDKLHQAENGGTCDSPQYLSNIKAISDIFKHTRGIISPCYAASTLTRRYFLSGRIYYVVLIAWLHSLFSPRPLTLVHLPRLFLYFMIGLYRYFVLYFMGSVVERQLLAAFDLRHGAHDFSDHAVLSLMGLLLLSIEFVVVGSSHDDTLPVGKAEKTAQSFSTTGSDTSAPSPLPCTAAHHASSSASGFPHPLSAAPTLTSTSIGGPLLAMEVDSDPLLSDRHSNVNSVGERLAATVSLVDDENTQAVRLGGSGSGGKSQSDSGGGRGRGDYDSSLRVEESGLVDFSIQPEEGVGLRDNNQSFPVVDTVATTRRKRARFLVFITRAYCCVSMLLICYAGIFTAAFFHTPLETFVGFSVGLLGLFGAFWALVGMGVISLRRLGIFATNHQERAAATVAADERCELSKKAS